MGKPASIMDKSMPPMVHFVGIGGIGMSALARWFKAQKWAVSGSDLAASGTTQELHKEGANVKIGHKKSNLPKSTRLVIYSQAIRPDNPELRAARRHKIPILSYPEAIGRLTEKYKTIAIAGAHGKSTTTAFVALALIKTGFDPTVIIGTKLKEFGGKNFRKGRGGWLVLEADEFGRSFLHYSPTLAIITNIDREHLDTYKNLAGVQKAFLQFIANVKSGGVLILNKDSKSLFGLKKQITRIAEQKILKMIWFSVNSSLARKVKKSFRLPGEHNLANAVGAFTAATVLGPPDRKILSAISGYRGSWRRMEYKGRCLVSGVRCQVFDDYAHHPTEIKATLRAFREKFPRSPIVCIFQPHQAKRLAALFSEFQQAFDIANIVLILPLYKVPGRDEKIVIDSEALVRTIQRREPKKSVFYLKNPGKIKAALSVLLRTLPAFHSHPPVIVMMGAGDIVNYTKLLL